MQIDNNIILIILTCNTSFFFERSSSTALMRRSRVDFSFPQQYAIFDRTKVGIFQSCPRLPKLWVQLRCLKVSLHIRLEKTNSVHLECGMSDDVKRAQMGRDYRHRRERKFLTVFIPPPQQMISWSYNLKFNVWEIC